jgi:hypothetical protein
MGSEHPVGIRVPQLDDLLDLRVDLLPVCGLLH